MKQSEKQQVKNMLAIYCERKGSQNKAAASLNGVSTATVSQMLNDNWEAISEDMWRSIAAQVGYDARDWTVVETRGYKRMYSLLKDAQSNSEVFAVTGDAGCGKSEAIGSYVTQHRNVYMLTCSEFWNRKHFLAELLRTMGREVSGFTVAEMMGDAIFFLKRAKDPLLVLDEFDKLPDQVLYFFITIYNELEGHCGMVISSTDYLSKRINKGIRTGRKGYVEIYSRFGRKFIPMPAVNESDVAGVCVANGITDTKTIEGIIIDCDCDLRRVKRLIHAAKKSFDAKN